MQKWMQMKYCPLQEMKVKEPEKVTMRVPSGKEEKREPSMEEPKGK